MRCTETEKADFYQTIADYLTKTVDCTNVRDIAMNVQIAVGHFLDVALVGIFIKQDGELKQIIPSEGLPQGFFFRESKEYAAIDSMETGKTVYRKTEDYKDEHLKQQMISLGGKAVLSVPIMAGGDILGGFSVILKSECNPGKDVHGFCLAICNCFSVQLKNALLHQELERQLSAKIKVETDLDAIFQGSVDMICILDSDGYIKRMNPTFEKRLGYPREELFGTEICCFAHPEDKSYVQHVVKHIRKEGAMTGFCHRFLTKGGKALFLEVDVRYMEDTGDIIAIARDTTDQKAAEEKNLILEKSIEMEQMKTEFFSNISHEFKTPINIILSSVDLLKLKLQRNDGKLYEEQYERFFGYTEQSSYKLLRLISNLLDATKIESGAMPLLGQECFIVPLIRQIVESAESYAQTHGISIFFDTDMREEDVLYCDQDKVDRILLNLISNSIKNTSPGGSIRVKLSDMPQHVHITVCDDGKGIPEAMLPYIFEKFKVRDKGLVKNCDGTGVGLSIVKGLTELHEGTVGVESVQGKGSTFSVTLSKNLRSRADAAEWTETQAQQNVELHKSRLQMEMSNIE